MGEKVAAEFLVQKGLTIIGKNVRTSYGEIDLIAQENNTIVFVEVKTRTSGEYGPPETGITPQKQIHMVNAAQAYIQAQPEQDISWRMDVIAIHKPSRNQPPEIVHFENVQF